MPFPNDLPVLVNPAATDSMASPSHAISEHTEENNAIMSLARMWRARHGTDPGIVNIRGVSVGGTYVVGDGSNGSSYWQAAVDSLPDTGGLLVAPPGRYGLTTGITVNNKGSIWILGLAAPRRVDPLLGSALTTNGCAFVGLTAAMTMWTFARSTGDAATRGGPKFTNFGFENNTVKQKRLTITAATNVGTTGTFTIGASHGIAVGDIVFVKNTYTADGSSVYNGRHTVVTSPGGGTTITVTLPSTPSGAATVFGTLSYDTLPTAIAPGMRGVNVTNMSHGVYEDCSFFGLNVGVELGVTTTYDVNETAFVRSRFVYCNTGVLAPGAGAEDTQAFTMDTPEFVLARNQIGVDVQARAEGVDIMSPHIIMGGDNSGDGAIGVSIRKGGEFTVDGPRIDADVRVGLAQGIKVGASGTTMGVIDSPKIRERHVEGRKLIGIELNGLDAANTVHGVQINGGVYNGCYRGVRMGQFTKGNVVNGGGFTDCERGVLMSAGSTGNLVAFPTQAVGAVGGSLLVEDLGSGNTVMFERDFAQGLYGALDLNTQAAPATPAAGHVKVFADTNGVVNARKTDGSIVALEATSGGGGATVGVVPIMRARLANRSTTLLSATGEYSLLKWTVPASFATAAFTVEGDIWVRCLTGVTAPGTVTVKLLVGGVVRIALGMTMEANDTTDGYHQHFMMTVGSLSGTTSQFGNFNSAMDLLASGSSTTLLRLRQQMEPATFSQNIVNSFDIDMVLSIPAGAFPDAATGAEAIVGNIKQLA